MEIGAESVKVRVPAPMALLKAKIANATEIDQTNRQDEKHVRILHAILPCYFEDCDKAAVGGKLSERDLVNRLHYLKEIVSSEAATGLFKKLGLSVETLFTPARDSSLHKVQEFCKYQLS